MPQKKTSTGTLLALIATAAVILFALTFSTRFGTTDPFILP